MAQSGNYTPIKTYHSNTPSEVPTLTNLLPGELAVNIADGKIYSRNDNNEIVELSGGNLHEHPASAITDLTSSVNSLINTYVNENVNQAPAGGTTNQVLTKLSNTNYDYDWVDSSGGGGGVSYPAGGDTGQVLSKASATDDDVEWVDNLANGINATGHRYWRISLSFDLASIGIREVDFFTGGLGFAGGKRWLPGTQHNNTTNAPVPSNGPNTTTSASGALTTLVNGLTSGAVVFTGNEVGPELTEIDFDFTDPIAITSIRLTGLDADDTIDEIKVYYSDDDTTYTLAGTFDSDPIPASLLSPTPHLVLIEDPSPLDENSAVFDSSVRTIPEVVIPEASSGSMWTFSSQNEAGNFNAVAGTYYLLQSGTQTVTLPASPSAGDIVGIKSGGGTVTVNRNGSTLEGTSFGSSSYTVKTQSTSEQDHVSLVFSSTLGWQVFAGALEIAE